MQGNGANQTMPALVGFGKVISRANDAVIKDIKRYMLAVAASVQMHGMGYIPRQEQQA
jgi:hypothetical protein